MTFAERLKALGFASYGEYLGSPLWAQAKLRYRESGLPRECLGCGSLSFQFHHRTYRRLGKERPTDFVPVCGSCHEAIHVYEREHKAKIRDTDRILAAIHGWSDQERDRRFAPFSGKASPAVTPLHQKAPRPGWVVKEKRVRRRVSKERRAILKAERREAARILREKERLEAEALRGMMTPEEHAKEDKNRRNANQKGAMHRYEVNEPRSRRGKRKCRTKPPFYTAPPPPDPNVVLIRNADGSTRIWHKKSVASSLTPT